MWQVYGGKHAPLGGSFVVGLGRRAVPINLRQLSHMLKTNYLWVPKTKVCPFATDDLIRDATVQQSAAAVAATTNRDIREVERVPQIHHHLHHNMTPALS